MLLLLPLGIRPYYYNEHCRSCMVVSHALLVPPRCCACRMLEHPFSIAVLLLAILILPATCAALIRPSPPLHPALSFATVSTFATAIVATTSSPRTLLRNSVSVVYAYLLTLTPTFLRRHFAPPTPTASTQVGRAAVACVVHAPNKRTRTPTSCFLCSPRRH